MSVSVRNGTPQSKLDKALSEAIGMPTAKQEEFYTAKGKMIEYCDVRMGGKTHAVRTKATLLALNYPGTRILICKRTYPSLREAITCPLQQTYAKLPMSIVYRDGVFMFPDGSEIHCAFCESKDDAHKFDGKTYNYVFIDDAHEMTFVHVGKIIRHISGVERYYFTYSGVA